MSSHPTKNTSLKIASTLTLGATVGAAIGSAPGAGATGTCPTGTTLGGNGEYCQITFDNSASASSWVVPTGVTHIDILAVGGGGGGGDAYSMGAGGGGGGGDVHVFTNQVVSTGQTLVVTVGAGGGAGGNGIDSSGSSSSNGGNSSVTDGAIWTDTANGGSGGLGIEEGIINGAAPTVQDGGASGNNNLGGAGVLSQGSPLYVYPLAGGGAGAGGAGQSAQTASNSSGLSLSDFFMAMQTTTALQSGAGGAGLVPQGGLFNNMTTALGGGGGGGAMYFSNDATFVFADLAGNGAGGGAKGAYGTPTVIDAATPTANSGGGGGGASTVLTYTNWSSWSGSPGHGSAGADGQVVIRFAVPNTKPSANVYFGVDRVNLTASTVTVLNTFVNQVISANVHNVTVTGFADPQGSVAHNMWLSYTRSHAVASYLNAKFAARHKSVRVVAFGRGVLHSTTNALARVVKLTSR
jgi:flagellar motor protein MotB